MAKNRRNSAEPVWNEQEGYWYHQKQYHGERKTFRSYMPGARGFKDCLAQEKKWLTDKRREAAYGKDSAEIPYNIRVSELGQKWIEELKLAGTSRDHYTQYESYLRNYVNPRYGARRVSGLVEQDLQDILLYAFSHPVDHHKTKLSHKTMSKMRAFLVAFMKYARKNGVSTLPLKICISPSKRSKAKNSRSLNLTSGFYFQTPSPGTRGK